MIDKARSFSTFVTFLLGQVLIDPGELHKKVQLKLGLRVPKKKRKRSRAEQAEDRGEYTQAKVLASVPARLPITRTRNARVGRRVDNQLWWFSQGISVNDQSVNGAHKPIRVLYVAVNSRPYTNSGYSKRTHSMVKAVRSTGVEISVLTRLGYPSVIGVPFSRRQDNVETVVYARSMSWYFPLSASQQFEQFKRLVVKRALQLDATILHTTTDFRNATVVASAAQELGIPWIYEVRGESEKTWLSSVDSGGPLRTTEAEHYRLSRQKELEAARAANGVVALSEISAQDLAANGVSRNKICVAPNSAEEALFESTWTQESAREHTGLAAPYLVGTVTSVVRYEGLETMLRAMDLLPKSVHFAIVGDGSDLNRLRDLVSDLGIGERVTFAGRKNQDNIVPWYKSLDLFVLPRIDAPVCRAVTPIKPLAAMALGIPVVASDLPAIREVTGGFARYVTPDDPVELARAVQEVRRGNYDADSARHWAETRTWDNVSFILKKFYEEISFASRGEL